MSKDRWKAYEWQKLKQLVERGFTYAAIATQMGRTKDEVKSKWLWETMAPVRKQQLLERKQARHQAYSERQRTAYLSGLPTPTHLAPADVLRERDVRLSTPQTITGMICGDPRPGWSALDRKQGASA